MLQKPAHSPAHWYGGMMTFTIAMTCAAMVVIALVTYAMLVERQRRFACEVVPGHVYISRDGLCVSGYRP